MLTIYYKFHDLTHFFQCRWGSVLCGKQGFLTCHDLQSYFNFQTSPRYGEHAISATRRERPIMCPTLTGATNITGESGRHQSNITRVYLFTHGVHNETQLRRWSQVCLLMRLTGQQKLTKQNYSIVS